LLNQCRITGCTNPRSHQAPICESCFDSLPWDVAEEYLAAVAAFHEPLGMSTVGARNARREAAWRAVLAEFEARGDVAA